MGSGTENNLDMLIGCIRSFLTEPMHISARKVMFRLDLAVLHQSSNQFTYPQIHLHFIH